MSSNHRDMKGSDFAEDLQNLEKKHVFWRADCLNMIASENVASPSVRKILCSDLGNRYVNVRAPTLSSGWRIFEAFYEGLDYLEKIERICADLLGKLFNAEYADYRATSGNIAVLNNWLALSKYGDRIMTTSAPCGGHGKGWDHLAIMLGRRIIHYPFDAREFAIDVDEAKKLVAKFKPKILVFGASQILFPAPIKELKKVGEEVGAYCVYDGSHVMGLIAGKHFQDPLKEGVTTLFGSTHKTFPGPQGGIILSNEVQEIREKLDQTLCSGILGNYHPNRVAALALAASEMLDFGRQYAMQVIGNAKALGEALHEEGFNVLCEHKGFTESHQILLNMSKMRMKGDKAAKNLSKANIIVNKIPLPLDRKGSFGGLRLGTSELTRTGMRESEMKHIAMLFRRCLIEKERTEKVKDEVLQFKRQYTKIHYSFDEGESAYESAMSPQKAI